MHLVRVSAGTICALGLALSFAACGPSAAQRGTGRGTVVSVDVERGAVVLDHGRIPGAMGAMKMSFEVADPKLLAQVSPGQTVEFDIELEGDQYRVTAIRPQQP
jgi:Cu/Ag efflux protein CusF